MKNAVLFLFLFFGIFLAGCATPKQYTISFDSNGGTDIPSILTDGKSSVHMPTNPEKEGYYFDGWFFDNATFEEDFFSNSLVNQSIEENITVYAKWDPMDITISFNSNGGNAVAAITQKYGSTVSAPIDPIKVGFTFAGWYEDSDLSLIFTFSTMPLTSLSLFAKWEPAIFTLRCIDYDSTVLFEEMVPFDALLDKFVLPTPIRIGYTFIGWGNIPEKMPASIVQLYAEYEAIPYEISFNTNGGSEVDSIVAPIATPIVEPNNPVKEGYTFTGWYQEETCDTLFILPSIMPAASMTLYAGWEIIEYTIYFEDNLTVVTPTSFSSKEDFLNAFYADFYQWFDDRVNPIAALHKAENTFTLTLNGETATWSSITQMRELDAYVVEKTIAHFIYMPFTRISDFQMTPVEDNNYFLNTEPYRTKYQDCDRYFLNAILTSYPSYDKGYNQTSNGSVQIFFHFHQWNQGVSIDAFNNLPVKFVYETLYEGSIIYPSSITYNILDEIPLATFTHSQMTFLGWYLHPLGAKDPISIIPKGTTGDFTLYMIWDYDLTTHKVVYLDYDESLFKTELLNPGQLASPPEVDEREGYIFQGWDKSIDMITNDITVTAQYEAIQYTIIFNKNIDEDVVEPVALTYTIDERITLPHLFLKGYIFVGWYESIDGSGAAIAHTTSGNKTLYASWIAIPDVLDYFKQISGEYTITSIHNREPNANPTQQTDYMRTITGLTPAMWSGDFLFSQDDVDNRWTMIEECKEQWDQGAIVHLMLHVTAPNQGEVGKWEGGVITELTDDEWASLIIDGGELNMLWKKRLDTYCEYLQYLEDNEVTVLFRPFHEMNQSLFWWGGRPGENGTAALYRLTRDYIENEKGLDNIIWVWNMQDLDFEWEAYNPGDEYWDIFSVDFYNGDGYTKAKYDLAVSIAEDKPMGIGECMVLPRLDELEAQPRWVFCMSWAELTFEYNTNEAIRDFYWSDRTLVREELPKLK